MDSDKLFQLVIPAKSSRPPSRKPSVEDLESDDIVIAVTGGIGSGKSTFMRLASGLNTQRVRHTPESLTLQIETVKFFDEDNGRHIVLMGIPGFGDTVKSDLKILSMIPDWLYASYKKQKLLSGILYLHRIGDSPVAIRSLEDYQLLRQLCGRDTLDKIYLTTTMWDQVDPALGLRRLEELKEGFWKALIIRGAQMACCRHDNDSSKKIIQRILDQEKKSQWEAPVFGENCHPPADLTDYIPSVNRYVAGGSFGDVYKCWLIDGLAKEVAIKALRFKFAMEGGESDKCEKMLRRELGIWRRLDHKNVVPFLGKAYGFGMLDALSLVSLWMPNETLHLFLARHDRSLDLGHRLRFLLDIANGLRYLHSIPIVHGDLNCNNVLLDVDYTARLADFGYASLAGSIPEALAYMQRTTARPGAVRWAAPELIDPMQMLTRTPKSDIYSYGCVALQESNFLPNAWSALTFSQVLSGKQPWAEVREEMAIIFQLAKGSTPCRPESRAIDDSHWNLIQQCWSPSLERPTAEVVMRSIEEFLSHCPPSPLLSEL